MKLGYACINMTLQQAGGITTNRDMKQKTFRNDRTNVNFAVFIHANRMIYKKGNINC